MRDPQNSVSKKRKKKKERRSLMTDYNPLFKVVEKEGFLGWEEAIERIVNNYILKTYRKLF